MSRTPQAASSRNEAVRDAQPAPIEIEELEVRYDTVCAVHGLTLQVRRGEIFGLLGPNGAGKTSTLSAVEGLLTPAGGKVRVLGLEAPRERVSIHRRVGVAFQSTAFFGLLKVWELVRFYAALYERFLTRDGVLTLLARFGLEEKADVRDAALSEGLRQRLVLALATVHDPEILILDEPTASLDPGGRRAIWTLIRELNAAGRTILLTTHYMDEAEALCDRVGILHRGKLMAVDSPARLVEALDAPSDIRLLACMPEDMLRGLPGVVGLARDNGRFVLRSRQVEATLLGLQRIALEHHQVLTDLSVRRPTLDDVFVALTAGLE